MTGMSKVAENSLLQNVVTCLTKNYDICKLCETWVDRVPGRVKIMIPWISV